MHSARNAPSVFSLEEIDGASYRAEADEVKSRHKKFTIIVGDDGVAETLSCFEISVVC
jgi:hypothetical protein